MKKALPWVWLATLLVLIADLAWMGFKLMDGEYDILPGAYLALPCFVIFAACTLYRAFTRR